MTASPLDTAVREAATALATHDLGEPDALFLCATGLGLLPGRLKRSTRIPLERISGVPEAWHGRILHAGELDDAHVWLLEDAPGVEEHGTSSPSTATAPWVRSFPVWLGAAAGAGILVHTSAGVALPPAGDGATKGASSRAAAPIPTGRIVVVSDHVNTSGTTPLAGLGDSTLGPLFPDLSYLHEEDLRIRALALAAEHGLPVSEGVCACTLGPALETPAERLWLARAGARVAVQDLAGPLLAAGHAGLGVLALVCVTDSGSGATDLASMLEQTEGLAPALDELVSLLGPSLASAASARFVEDAE